MFLNRLGEIRDRSYENQRYPASGLNLVLGAPSHAVEHLVYLDRAVKALQEHGAVDERLLPHLSPLPWEHIQLAGDYITGTPTSASPRMGSGRFVSAKTRLSNRSVLCSHFLRLLDLERPL